VSGGGGDGDGGGGTDGRRAMWCAVVCGGCGRYGEGSELIRCWASERDLALRNRHVMCFRDRRKHSAAQCCSSNDVLRSVLSQIEAL